MSARFRLLLIFISLFFVLGHQLWPFAIVFILFCFVLFYALLHFASSTSVCMRIHVRLSLCACVCVFWLLLSFNLADVSIVAVVSSFLFFEGSSSDSPAAAAADSCKISAAAP